MVQHLTTLEGVTLRNTWLTIGSFDGVHIGHRHLIKSLNEHAHQAGSISVVLTFHPHPSAILKGRTGAFYLTTPAEKVEFLDALGVDIVITHPFTLELSQSPAREYVSYLKNHLDFTHLWVGQDFALGRGREGNVPYLQMLGEEFNYQLKVIDPVQSDGLVVSSSLIRNLITSGDISKANNILGRNYQVMGKVVHGDGRGKLLGIPTANLDTGEEKLIPGAGVYACRVQIHNKTWPAAVNIGTRPTFVSTDQRSHVEAYVLDFSEDLYDQTLTLEFIKRLRGEERFSSVEDLLRQIYVDIEQTREITAANSFTRE